MEFYAQNGHARPIRLSEATRAFAYDSLHRVYGKDTLRVMGVAMDDVEGFSSFSPLKKYDTAVRRIVTEAPIRICEGERISGAATLGHAILHFVPATYGGDPIHRSVSHLTVDFQTVLREGINAIRAKAEAAYEKHRGSEREEFAASVLSCLDSFAVWHGRYLSALAEDPRYRENYERLKRVPFGPAGSFAEAVQSLWFTFAYLRLLGNWSGIGRLDVLLGDYLEKDLASGAITKDEARELLAHFFIKGCEWINGEIVGSGDAQHYQNILLSGIDEEGRDVTNTVTYLTLDILEELGISDFPTTVRLRADSDEALLRRVAEVMRYGGGTLAVYGEETVIRALVKDGYSEREARCFANDGCWETQIPGKTFFTYGPFDSLAVLLNKTLRDYEEAPDFDGFEALYRQYLTDLSERVEAVVRRRAVRCSDRDPVTGEFLWKSDLPCTAVSIFEEGCIEKGRSYLEGGPIYNVYAPHLGGLADTVNSLYAIKKMVYEEKRLSLSELLSILKNNWEGEEPLRQYAKNRYVYYGNDSDEVDGLASRLVKDFAAICRSFDGICAYHFPAGISTFGRQLEWSVSRPASPHGRRAGEVLAANCSPTPGSDRAGATAEIRSYCKLDHTELATGAALDVRLLPSSVQGEEGLEAMVSLLRGFVRLGGFFMQIDVVDASLLRRAQEHPEDYQTLSVRVSGWNARFVTLNREWQEMVIEQNECQ